MNYKLKPNNKGQSLIELIVAVGIFVAIVGGSVFLIIDSFVSSRLTKEITQAVFLAEEGMEAVRSIRDNSWDELSAGSYGLAVSGNTWIFQGSQEDISSQLQEGIRKIIIEDVAPDRKKIISQISWQFAGARSKEVQSVTYLTNWQKIVSYCQGICRACSSFLNRGACQRQDGCSWSSRYRRCTGICTPCESFLDRASCRAQSWCVWVEL